MKEITAVEFETEVIESDCPTLVCWGAEEWCSACRALAPVLEDVAKEVGDRVKFVKIDVDDANVLCQEYEVRSIPKLILFRDGLEIKEISGLVSREKILAMIENDGLK